MTIEGMAIDEFLNESGVLTDTLIEIGKVGNWVQAIGIIVVVWVIFQTVNLILNIRRVHKIKTINKKLDSLEEKIDKFIKGSKKKKK